MRFTPVRACSSRSLAAASMPPVMSSPAGPPFGGLYLKPPLSGGLCEGVTTMPSASPEVRPRLWVRMACEIAGMGVDTEEQRPVDALGLAVVTDRLRDRQHMPFVERDVERRAPVSRGPERDALRRYRRVGNLGVIRGDEPRHVDEQRRRCRLAGERTDLGGHGAAAMRLANCCGRGDSV